MQRLILGLMITSAFLANSIASANIIITEVMSQSLHLEGTNNDDWFELTNIGGTAINISAWSWGINAQVGLGFTNNLTIAAGNSVIITRETIGQANENTWRANWGNTPPQVVNLGINFPDFSGAGGTLRIFNELDAQVTSVTFGPATPGFSFEWDRAGISLGLSVEGENGAYRATSAGIPEFPGIDIGSPGISVVPEPTSLLLVGSAISLLCFRRRRG